MTSHRSLALIKLCCQALQHLLKVLAVVTQWSSQKVLSILWGLFDSIRSKWTLDLANNSTAELHEQPLHPDMCNGPVCASSTSPPTAAERYPLANFSSTIAPEPRYTAGSSELGSRHDFLNMTPSITQVSSSPTPLPNSFKPPSHDPALMQIAQTLLDGEDELIVITP